MKIGVKIGYKNYVLTYVYELTSKPFEVKFGKFNVVTSVSNKIFPRRK